MIQSVRREVGPYRSVFFPVEKPFFKAPEYLLFSGEVGFRFVVYLVERHSHPAVGLVESGIYPLVHPFPERDCLLVAGFPFT
ncbi:hypothetical protein SDC9_165255 [bioreactor metagenome]|uniref:Uncharacterized protein n=1 Tax=bioreactor metagenome TaxID=1076179 RepID=A0A645FW51_9ZZZZ